MAQFRNPTIRFKKGRRVKAFGFGMNNTDFHNGCRGLMFDVAEVRSCSVPFKIVSVIGVLCDDGSTEFFHPKQLEIVKPLKRKK